MTRFIALLRAVNVGGSPLPMTPLRTACAELGWTGVETYIQSGNVVFDADAEPGAVEAMMERLLVDRFALDRPVILRTAPQWAEYMAGNPFPLASREEPQRVLLGLSKTRPRDDAAAQLQARATAGERIIQIQDALWFHYPAGVGTSKLTPSLIDRSVGSALTARNWRTVVKLGEMAAA